MNRTTIRSILSKPLLSALLAAIIGGLAGGALAEVAPDSTRVSLSFTIAERSRQETPDYSYDGYYSLRASELVSDTLISWLSTPSVIKDIYSGAGIEIGDARAFSEAGRTFRAKKLSSQNVLVTFSAPDSDIAARLAKQAAKTLSERSAKLVLSPKDQSLFIVTASEPVIAASSLPPFAAACAGILMGAFLGLAAAYAYAGRKKDPQP